VTKLLLVEPGHAAPRDVMPMRGDLAPPDADRVSRPKAPTPPLWRLCGVLYYTTAVASLFWPLGLSWLL
jgi:hypothetical protein